MRDQFTTPIERGNMRPAAPHSAPQHIPRPDAVTAVIQHQIAPGAHDRYEAWLREITPTAQRFPGHQGINIIRPSEGTKCYTIVLRFDTLEHLQEWLASETRRQLVAEVEPLLERGDQVDIKTGLEFWFTPPTPAQRHPPPYKQFLLTLSAIFPLTLVVPWLVRPLFQAMPILGRPIVSNVITSAIIVGLMTYVIMPRYTRLVAGWLYRQGEGSKSREE
jgi:antibiotic biosynthesis monooxygenase (ABM) superfamily enzyme